jgi:signal peptidase II
MIYATAIFILCILTDQVTKTFALKNSYVINQGLALSLGQNLPAYLLISLTLTIIIVIALMNFKYWKINKRIPELVVMAGGVSNLTDRFWHTGVIDFLVIDFKISNLKLSTPIFNFADIIIMIGILWIIYRDIVNQYSRNLQP